MSPRAQHTLRGRKNCTIEIYSSERLLSSALDPDATWSNRLRERHVCVESGGIQTTCTFLRCCPQIKGLAPMSASEPEWGTQDDDFKHPDVVYFDDRVMSDGEEESVP